MCGTDAFLAFLALLFPPIAVWVKRGICSGDSIINLALCCLGYLPGLLHAWYIIWTYPDPFEYERFEQGEGAEHVTYYYVAQGPPPPRHAQYQSHDRPDYGTVQSVPNAQFPGQQSGTVNAFPAPKPAPQPSPQSNNQDAAGSSAAPNDNPPTYADVIKGDNKIQSQE